MIGKQAVLRTTALAGASLLAVFLCARQARAQGGPEVTTVETLKVTGARPVADAMDVIEKRYGVLIDYVDPQYVAPQDLELVRSVQGKPVMAPGTAPKSRTISVQYLQVPGTPSSVAPIYRCKTATLGCAPVTVKPEEGIGGLIQQVLDEFADQGGQVFTVRKLDMPYGARWQVYPTQARDSSGALVSMPDLLGARIFIPKAQRRPEEMFELIAQQLTQTWGAKFSVALLWWTVNPHMPPPGEGPPELGAEGVSAWRAISDLMGPRGTTGVLRLFYGTSDRGYGINIANLPYREPPRPPTPAPAPAKPAPSRVRSPEYWLGRARTPDGIQEIQRGLAKLGHLQTPPTTQWDANATAALQRFQYAVGLPQTGKFDRHTALMLSPSLPLEPMLVPAKPPMDIELLNWLNTTQSGTKEVQSALATAGFYNGPINGHLYTPTIEALEAFQTANGLKPTGLLDWATALELSPFLPQAK